MNTYGLNLKMMMDACFFSYQSKNFFLKNFLLLFLAVGHDNDMSLTIIDFLLSLTLILFCFQKNFVFRNYFIFFKISLQIYHFFSDMMNPFTQLNWCQTGDHHHTIRPTVKKKQNKQTNLLKITRLDLISYLVCVFN